MGPTSRVNLQVLAPAPEFKTGHCHQTSAGFAKALRNPNATLDTLAAPEDDVRHPDCRRRHGHCGLAAEPGPWEV
jgi:hypothetical protein